MADDTELNMADERSTDNTHSCNPNQKLYDWSYYNALMPYITGKVLDIGSGAGLFVREYSNRPEVKSVLCIDKYGKDMPELDKVTFREWVCPEPLPAGDFDTVVSTEFIEHIERDLLEPLLEQIKGRRFVGSTPNKRFPTTNPFHLYEYTLPELDDILRAYFGCVHIWDTGQDCTVWVAE